MADLTQTIETAEHAERRMARRRLLASPFVGQRADPEGYAAVLRHRRDLAEWFAEHAGWQLVVDETGGFARLHKTPSHRDATRPATCGHDHRPFDRRRYTLLCLALAVLDEGRGQTTLRQIAEGVTAASRAREGIAEFDGTRHAERRALVDALRHLVSLEVLRERDGDAAGYALGGTGDVLYDVEERRIAQLIAAPSSPSLTDGPDGLPVEVYPDTEEGERARARHRVMRRLLDDPVVYYDELNEVERGWIHHALGHVHRILEDDVGLLVERRAEGLAAVDPARELSDEVFPDGGSTVKHAALLLAERLTELARSQPRTVEGGTPPPPPVIPEPELAAWTTQFAQEIGVRSGWRVLGTDGPESSAALTEEALALLARFGLVRRVEGGWLARPAIARFAPDAPGSRAALSSSAPTRRARREARDQEPQFPFADGNATS